MENIAYYDGTIGLCEELTVPFNDRSHFFGDGVYDATIAANGHIYLLDDHLDRFFDSANMFRIVIPMSKQEIAELLNSLLARVDGSTQFVYWQVTRGVAPRMHAFEEGAPGKLWVYIRPVDLPDLTKPKKLITLEDKRFLYGNAKTLNLLPAVMYAQAAELAGADEAVLVRDGYVTECAHSNVSVLKEGVLYSHPNDNKILRGIAKTHLLQACHRLGISVVEEPFTLPQLMTADEVIVTASSTFCAFADEVDGQPVGGHDQQTLARLRHELIREFLDYVHLPAMPQA